MPEAECLSCNQRSETESIAEFVCPQCGSENGVPAPGEGPP